MKHVPRCSLILLTYVLLCGCWPRATSLEDVTEEVIAKKEGVTIDIEPGQKK